MQFPWLKDPKTNKVSVTLTVFIYGFMIAALKLLFSGIEIAQKFKMSEFSGVDFAAVIGALGTVYSLRKNKTILPDEKVDK